MSNYPNITVNTFDWLMATMGLSFKGKGLLFELLQVKNRAKDDFILSTDNRLFCCHPDFKGALTELKEARLIRVSGKAYRGEAITILFDNDVCQGPPPQWGSIRRVILKRDGNLCQYCGGPAESVDHIVPRTKGGDERHSNLVAACTSCNSRKKDRTPEEAGMPLVGGGK